MTVHRRAWPVIAILALFACSSGKMPASVQSPVAPASTPSFVRLDVGVLGSAAATVAPGQSLQLYALAVDGAGTKLDVTNLAQWSSGNAATASVSAGGLVTGIAEGAVTVSATYLLTVGTLSAQVAQLCAVSLSPSSLIFNAVPFVPCSDDDAVYGQRVTVTASKAACTWLAASDVPWLGMDCYQRSQTYDPHRGGSGALAYATQANTTQSTRVGHITVTFNDGSKLVHTVTEEGARCLYSLAPSEGAVPHEGGSGAVDLTVTPASCDWVLTKSSDVTMSATSGVGSQRLTYQVAPRGTISAYQVYLSDPRGQSPGATFTIRRLPG